MMYYANMHDVVCYLTLCAAVELSQILPERPSFMGSENEEVFVPPVLSGLLLQPGNER